MEEKDQKTEEREIVWVACRAERPCGCKTSEVVFKKKTPGGGSIIRYRCTECGGTFHIQI